MEIKIPEPAGPSSDLYDLNVEQQFDQQELEKRLRQIEADLDRICDEELKSGKYVIVEYLVSILRRDTNKHLGHDQGGFVLIDEYTKKSCVPIFQKDYKRTFQKVLEQAKGQSFPARVVISVVGVGDCITETVETNYPSKDPNEE